MPEAKRSHVRLTLILLVLALLIVSPPLKPVRSGLVKASQPLARLLHAAGVATSPIRSNTDQNTAAQLQEAQAHVITLEAENAELRRAAQFSERSHTKTIGADIIGRSGEAFRRTLKINRGSRDGLTESAAVLVDGWLIGKVTQTENSTADVQLVTDPDFRLTVTIGQSGLAGLAVGALGGLKVERLPLTEQVSAGGVVLSSAVGGQVPSGWPIGTVNDVKTSDDGVFHDITVDIPIQLETIRLVQVIVP